MTETLTDRPNTDRILLLLRHAKSSWDDPALDDHDRPLAHRGILGAMAMGRYVAQHYPDIDLAVCSSAVRCRNTLALVQQELAAPIAWQQAPDAYLCGPARLLDLLHALPAQKNGAPLRTVMLVAHNPDLQELALHLALPTDNGSAPLRAQMAEKFPTAALAAFHMRGDRWSALSAANCRLSDYQTPKTVMAIGDRESAAGTES